MYLFLYACIVSHIHERITHTCMEYVHTPTFLSIGAIVYFSLFNPFPILHASPLLQWMLDAFFQQLMEGATSIGGLLFRARVGRFLCPYCETHPEVSIHASWISKILQLLCITWRNHHTQLRTNTTRKWFGGIRILSSTHIWHASRKFILNSTSHPHTLIFRRELRG